LSSGEAGFSARQQTGYEISEVYVSAGEDGRLGADDVLCDDTLDDGETLTVRFRRCGKSCQMGYQGCL